MIGLFNVEKCDFYYIIVLSLNFLGYFKMEYGLIKMEERFFCSSGGKLVLWVFYIWCGYFVWVMVCYIWVMSWIFDVFVLGFESDLGFIVGKWLGVLVGFLFMVLVGVLLGSIVWYI